jgi:hypothetical protein
MAEKEKSTFIEKLKEKQENQRALVTAIDDLHKEQKRILVVRIKYFFSFIGFVIACWYSFDAVAPFVGPILAEFRFQKMTGMDTKTAPSNQPAPVPKPVAGVDFSRPDMRQEAAVVEGWVAPLPATAADDPGFYEKFRPAPVEAQTTYVTAFTPAAAEVPKRETYNNLNQLPPAVVELDKAGNLDKKP